MIAMNPDAIKCPYLVGDLYYTTRAGNPAQTWPGTTWEAIEDRFIRGADGAHPAGSTGGSWEHAQTEEEVGPHRHGINVRGWDYAKSVEALENSTYSYNEADQNTGVAASVVNFSGGAKPMDITNPYYSAYIWRRIA